MAAETRPLGQLVEETRKRIARSRHEAVSRGRHGAPVVAMPNDRHTQRFGPVRIGSVCVCVCLCMLVCWCVCVGVLVCAIQYLIHQDVFFLGVHFSSQLPIIVRGLFNLTEKVQSLSEHVLLTHVFFTKWLFIPTPCKRYVGLRCTGTYPTPQKQTQR